MGRKPMITKACPKCNLQVAVASKKCKCGHSFFNTRRNFRNQSPEVVDERRRTSRVKREKPNYYDSQEYDKRKKRIKKPKPIIEQIVQNKQLIKPRVAKVAPKLDKEKEIDSTAARAKRRRQRKEEEDGGGDLVAKLTPEKQELASMILAEINRKYGAVVWKPF